MWTGVHNKWDDNTHNTERTAVIDFRKGLHKQELLPCANNLTPHTHCMMSTTPPSKTHTCRLLQAQLEEVATQEDPALEPAAVLPTSKGGGGGGGGVEHLRRVGGGGGGGIEVAVGTGAPNSSREGRDCEIHGGRAVAAVEVAAAATATTADLVEDGEDVVLDALLGLPAAPPVAPVGAANVASDGTGAREYSCTAVVGRPDRGGGGGEGGGGEGRGGGRGGSADELEDWLDGLLV